FSSVCLAGLLDCHIHLVKSFYSLSVVSKSIGSDHQKLSLRDYNSQVSEALAGLKVMNKIIGLGMPVRQKGN
ncbi:MAG: hypothetical protein ACRC9R_11710, partial [Enterovibrio sp.]